MKSITAVTFDLWQTLILDNRELGLARAQLRIDGAIAALSDAGEAFSREHVWQAYRQCYRTCHAIRAEERDVTFEEQVQIFVEHIDAGLSTRLPVRLWGRIVSAYCDSFFHHPPSLHPDTDCVLRQLKSEGYLLGLISNTGMTPGLAFRKYLHQVGILGCFDVLTFSDETQLSKPARQIFLQTTSALGAPPEQTVHVGDHVSNDVVGAKRAGLKAVWIKGNSEPQEAMEIQPDLTVQTLGEVGAAVERLARGQG